MRKSGWVGLGSVVLGCGLDWADLGRFGIGQVESVWGGVIRVWAGVGVCVVRVGLYVCGFCRLCSFTQVQTRIGLNEQGPANARKIRPQVHKTLDGAQICHATVGLPTR